MTGQKKEKDAGSIYLERPWLRFYPEGLAPEVEIPNISLVKAFDDAVSRWKDKTAILFYGRKMSYEQLRKEVDSFATALSRLGVKKGSKIALYMLNCPQFIIAYFGALKAGAVLTTISPVYVTTEIKHQIEDSQAQVIICQDILYEFVKRANARLGTIILTRIDEYLPRMKKIFGKTILRNIYQKMEIPVVEIDESEEVHWFQDLLKNTEPDPPRIAFDPKEDLAVLPYTGGTTGLPKGVMLTHYNLIADATINQAFWSYSFEPGRELQEGKEVLAAYLPFYHIFGQVTVMITGLIRGYQLIIFTTPDLDDMIRSIGKENVTFFLGVPSLYELLSDYDKTDRVDWKRLKFLFSGADALLEETSKDWERRTGTAIYEGLGLSETSSGIHVNPLGRRKIGSFGIPLPNTMSALVDPETQEFVQIGEIGELLVKGPQVTRGYWNNAEETENAFREIDGEKWLKTGDLARMDEEGYFYFYDRKRDLIKYKGYSVFAREVEEVLKSHAKVMEAAVIGVPDPKVGANIKAAIVLEADARGKLSEEEIIDYCAGKLAHYKVPRILEFRGEIPKTDVGKVSRRELREESEE
jgi:long-chain acyl-CoA synthetase